MDATNIFLLSSLMVILPYFNFMFELTLSSCCTEEEGKVAAVPHVATAHAVIQNN
jgi:hypothetical protein